MLILTSVCTLLKTFVHWCDNNHLKLNVSKTQEMIFDAKCIVAEEKIPVLFYCSIIESILHYGITAWFGNVSVQLKSQLSCLMKTAMKITGSTYPMISIQEIF